MSHTYWVIWTINRDKARNSSNIYVKRVVVEEEEEKSDIFKHKRRYVIYIKHPFEKSNNRFIIIYNSN